MSDLPHSWPGYIQTEDTQFKSAVSENLAQKLGQALNFIYDKQFSTVDFTSSGTWVCPQGVTKVIAFGYGGGAGGDAYGLAGPNPDAILYHKPAAQSSVLFLSVTPGTTYDIIVGAGGSGASSSNAGFVSGSNGSNTIFKILAGATICTWYGGGINEILPTAYNNVPLYAQHSANFLNGSMSQDTWSGHTIKGYGGLSGPGGAGGAGAARNSSGGTATASSASANSGAAGGSAIATANAATAVAGSGGSGFLSLAYLV